VTGARLDGRSSLLHASGVGLCLTTRPGKARVSLQMS